MLVGFRVFNVFHIISLFVPGLGLATKVDPAQKEKEETRQWFD